MGEMNRSPFQTALNRYRKARSRIGKIKSERADNAAISKIDDALDALVEIPSPTISAFGEKISILKAEYGIEAQPRHIRAIYADVAILALMYADIITNVMPTT